MSRMTWVHGDEVLYKLKHFDMCTALCCQ